METPLPKQFLIEYNHKYPDFWTQLQIFHESRARGELTWPSWCFIPLAAVYAVLSKGLTLDPDKHFEIGMMGALASWRVSQGIYRFDPDVLQELLDTEIDNELQIDLFFRLPEWCVYIEIDRDIELIGHVHGFFVHLEDDAKDHHPELRFVLLYDENFIVLPFHLTSTKINDCLEATRQYTISNIQKDGAKMKDFLHNQKLMKEIYDQCLFPFLPLVMYLCTEEPDFLENQIAAMPKRPKPTKTKNGMRWFEAPKLTTWEIGYRIGAALRIAKNKHAAEGSPDSDREGYHAKKTPHIRRAHFHTFFRGENRAERFLKWLPPIPVNIEDYENLIPTIRRVK